MKKKIWLINHYATGMHLSKGGRHYWFAKELLKRGYEPTIICANTYHNSKNYEDTGNEKYIVKDVDGIPFVFVKTKSAVTNGLDRIISMITFYLNLSKISKSIKKKLGKPDVILASSVHPLSWLAGYRVAKKNNIKLIAETRDLWPETLIAMGATKRTSLAAKILYKLEKHIYKNADALIFTMAGGEDYLRDIGLNRDNVYHINNGLDLELYNDNLMKYCYPDDDLDNEELFKIMYTGSMGQANDLIWLVKSAEEIQRQGLRNIRFVLFGSGPQKNEFIKYIKDKQIKNIVFKDNVEKKYIPSILKKGNLNVFTGQKTYLYKYGISLNKMFDYFASGKATLSNLECRYDLLEKYQCGITVKGESVDEIVKGILFFYNMPKAEYDIYCENAIKAAKDHDFKKHTDKLENIITAQLQ